MKLRKESLLDNFLLSQQTFPFNSMYLPYLATNLLIC